MPHRRQLPTGTTGAASAAEDDDHDHDPDEDVEMACDKLLHACELAKSLETRIRSMAPDRLQVDPPFVRCSLALAAAQAISAFNDAVKCLVSIKPDAAPRVVDRSRSDAIHDLQPEDMAIMGDDGLDLVMSTTTTRSPAPPVDVGRAAGAREPRDINNNEMIRWDPSSRSSLQLPSPRVGIIPKMNVIKRLTATTTTTTTSSRSPDLESPDSCNDQPSINDPIAHRTGTAAHACAADPTFTAQLLPVANTISGAASDSSCMLSPRAADTDWTAARKRKVLAKVTRRIAAEGAEQVETGEGAAAAAGLDDGGTWRKYGQKAILGARYPRSYYRCTQRSSRSSSNKDAACTAKKLVQRCDDDPNVLEVTYKGEHTCGGGGGTTSIHIAAAAAAAATSTSTSSAHETTGAAAKAAAWSSPHMAAATFNIPSLLHYHLQPPDGSNSFQQLSHPSRETLRYNPNNEVLPLFLPQNNFATEQRLTFPSSSDSVGSSKANAVSTKSLTSIIHSNIHDARAPTVDSNAPTPKLSQNTTYQVQVSSTFDTMDFMNFLNSIEHD